MKKYSSMIGKNKTFCKIGQNFPKIELMEKPYRISNTKRQKIIQLFIKVN